MKFVLTLSIQLTAFLATALICVWFMTRPTSAAKRVFGITRLLPAPAEAQGVVSGSVQDRLLRVARLLGSRIGIAGGEKMRKRCRAAKSEQHGYLCCGPPAGADSGASDLELFPPDHVFLDNANDGWRLSRP